MGIHFPGVDGNPLYHSHVSKEERDSTSDHDDAGPAP